MHSMQISAKFIIVTDAHYSCFAASDFALLSGTSSPGAFIFVTSFISAVKLVHISLNFCLAKCLAWRFSCKFCKFQHRWDHFMRKIEATAASHRRSGVIQFRADLFLNKIKTKSGNWKNYFSARSRPTKKSFIDCADINFNFRRHRFFISLVDYVNKYLKLLLFVQRKKGNKDNTQPLLRLAHCAIVICVLSQIANICVVD